MRPKVILIVEIVHVVAYHFLGSSAFVAKTPFVQNSLSLSCNRRISSISSKRNQRNPSQRTSCKAVCRRNDAEPSRTSNSKGMPDVGSHIALIKSYNLAGMVSADYDGDNETIVIDFGAEPNLVAITGETGSGKSVLISRVADLVTGGKANPSMVPAPTEGRESEGSQAMVEMVIKLSEPHLSWFEEACRKVGLEQQNGSETLVLKRTISIQQSTKGSSKTRLKSACEINSRPVTLKALRIVTAPLLTIVDAAAAATALSRPASRMSVIDTGVPLSIKAAALEATVSYRQAREYRQDLERELNSRVLPSSYSPDGGGDSLALLQHWVDELDTFEERMNKFRCSAISENADLGQNGTTFNDAIQLFQASCWFDLLPNNEAQNRDLMAPSAVSAFYSNLLDFREAVKQMDAQLQAARSACETLSSLSSPDSAITALERARNFLFDASGGMGGDVGSDDNFSGAAEDAHERLNALEDALSLCVQSLEDTNKGLISTLERMRGSIHVSLEDIDAIIVDWNTLARKHNISPFLLPACHKTLRSELDGNVETRKLLPKAIEKENETLVEFERACRDLTIARQSVAGVLSQSVTQNLPFLGMERSVFLVHLNGSSRQCTDSSAYGYGKGLGVDSVDFLLIHRQSSGDVNSGLTEATEDVGYNNGDDRRRRGKLEGIGSAGEKARILLAIETTLPGSVGVLCGADALRDTRDDTSRSDDVVQSIPSVAVIYDEIDAHVGGRAAVALAKLLADQTRPLSRNDTLNEGATRRRGRGQVISITHSPSVAAIADRHIVIQKPPSSGSSAANTNQMQNRVLVSILDGTSRRKELGRMAAGDLAHDEALVFADALLRDGELQKKSLN